MGAWVTFGLGTLNQNLPAFVVMLDPRGGPPTDANSWTSGYRPATFQGTCLRHEGEPILNLQGSKTMTRQMQRSQVDTINALNTEHQAARPGYSELAARIANYELAFQLQTTAPEVTDLSQETEATHHLYGLHDKRAGNFGRQCLLARRLVERGVRFVQLYSGGNAQQSSWDAHHGVEKNLSKHAPEVDQPIAGLISDFKRSGLLDETLVIWGGEFGRQPTNENKGPGTQSERIYHVDGGRPDQRGNQLYGETDELGMQAVDNPRHVRDIHATILHLLGLDHRQRTYFYGGLEQKLTGVQQAKVIQELIVWISQNGCPAPLCFP